MQPNRIVEAIERRMASD